MEIFDFSNAEYSNRNGSYGGAAGDKDGIVINGEPWIAKYPKSNEGMAGDSCCTSRITENCCYQECRTR